MDVNCCNNVNTKRLYIGELFEILHCLLNIFIFSTVLNSVWLALTSNFYVNYIP